MRKHRGIFAEQKGASPTVSEKVKLKFKAGNGTAPTVQKLNFQIKAGIILTMF